MTRRSLLLPKKKRRDPQGCRVYVGGLGTWGDLTALLTTVSGRGENRENILLTAFRRRGTVVMQIDLV